MEEKPSCELCRELYKGKEEEPPCRDCLPELMEENEEAVHVWPYVRNQVIVGFNQVIDLNILAVESVMRMFKVKNKKRVLSQVFDIFRTFNDERK